MQYRADIDGLRAIAVGLVIAFHFDFLTSTSGGFIGVDIFFVISGYLITSLVKQRLDAGRFSLLDFYAARVRRLAPALLAVLTLTLAVALAVLLPADLTSLARELLAAQFYVANIFYWQTLNYFGLAADSSFLLHTWSLAVEEQFYLFFPVALLLIHRYLRTLFWPLLVVAALASFALNVALVERMPELTFYLLPTRAWELLCGACISAIPIRKDRSPGLANLLGASGVVVLLLALWLHSPATPFPGYFALLPVLSAAFIIMAGGYSSSIVNKALSLPALVYVGRISYPLYLVHWPVHVFAGRLLGDSYGSFARVLMVALTGVISVLLYTFLEQPVRRSSLLQRRSALYAAYVAGLLATALAFVAIVRTNGLPARFPEDVVAMASLVNDKSPPLAECAFSDAPADAREPGCPIGDPAQEPTWLIIGDSHAWAAHEAFHQWLVAEGASGTFMFRHSCLPLADVNILGERGECKRFVDQAFRLLETSPTIKNVLLVSTWSQVAEGRLVQGEPGAEGKDSFGIFDTAFDNTIARLNAMNVSVHVWEPVPGAKRSVPEALALARLRDRPARVEWTLDEYREKYRFIFRALERNSGFIDGTVSPAGVLCDTGHCRVEQDGMPLYFDSGHLSRSSTPVWVELLRKSLDVKGAANDDR